MGRKGPFLIPCPTTQRRRLCPRLYWKMSQNFIKGTGSGEASARKSACRTSIWPSARGSLFSWSAAAERAKAHCSASSLERKNPVGARFISTIGIFLGWWSWAATKPLCCLEKYGKNLRCCGKRRWRKTWLWPPISGPRK